MEKLTLTELTTILRECAGSDEAVDLGGDIHDTHFVDLGYDSVALLEVASRIQQRYGVRLSDEVVGEIRTPRQFIEVVDSAAAPR
jgi:act minimal PKS acyl carrier protein